MPQAYQAPFAPHLGQTSQQKTTEPTRLLDLTKYRLYDDLATAVQRLTCRTPDFRRHTFFGRGLQGFGGRSMVPLAGRGDVGLKSSGLQGLGGRFAVITAIQRRRDRVHLTRLVPV